MLVAIFAGKRSLSFAVAAALAFAFLTAPTAPARSTRTSIPVGGNPSHATTGKASVITPTFTSKTAFLDEPLPSLANAITVSSAPTFAAAIANAHAGETINVLGNVVIPGEFTGFNRVISGGIVNVVFQPGAGFTGMAGSQLPAIWLRDSGGWRVWGGKISNPDGNGILVYAMPGPFTWTGFTVTDTADTCVAVYPVWGNINRLVLKGVAGTSEPNLSYDPHAEKGTGIHSWNIADGPDGLVENSVFAADTLNQATGAAVEVDTGQIGPNVSIYARATHLGFAVPGTTWTGDARDQVAGNVIQLWGAAIPAGGSLNIKYVEAHDIQGRIVETNGMYPSAAPRGLSAASIDYGTASGPILKNWALSKVPYAVIDDLKTGSLHQLP